MCVWALLLVTQLASAHSPVHPETRVGDFEVAAEACVQLSALANSSGHQEKLDASTAEASGYPHAAKGAGLLARSEAAGGHLVARHVGQSAAALDARIAAQANVNVASSFRTLAEAEGAVASVLSRNTQAVSSWV